MEKVKLFFQILMGAPFLRHFYANDSPHLRIFFLDIFMHDHGFTYLGDTYLQLFILQFTFAILNQKKC
jgi:hypothetical protein